MSNQTIQERALNFREVSNVGFRKSIIKNLNLTRRQLQGHLLSCINLILWTKIMPLLQNVNVTHGQKLEMFQVPKWASAMRLLSIYHSCQRISKNTLLCLYRVMQNARKPWQSITSERIGIFLEKRSQRNMILKLTILELQDRINRLPLQSAPRVHR